MSKYNRMSLTIQYPNEFLNAHIWYFLGDFFVERTGGPKNIYNSVKENIRL